MKPHKELEQWQSIPYKFPARSRAAMIDAMEAIGGYYERPYHYPFSWNVKIHSRYGDTDAATLEEHNQSGTPFLEAWDDAYRERMENDFNVMGWIIDDMRRSFGMEDQSYCTYPGDDGGQFSFSFGGRQGGHLLLEEAFGHKLRGLDFDDLREDTDGYPFAFIRKLYRAVMCMEHDFRAEAVRNEWLYQLAFDRASWEEQRADEITAACAEAVTARRERAAIASSMLYMQNEAAYIGAGRALRHAGDTMRAARRSIIALACPGRAS